MKAIVSPTTSAQTDLEAALQILRDVLVANFIHGQHEEEQSIAINLAQNICEAFLHKRAVDELHILSLVHCLQTLKTHSLRDENSGIYWADAIRHAVQQVTKQLTHDKM